MSEEEIQSPSIALQVPLEHSPSMTYNHHGSTASSGVPLIDHCLRYSDLGAGRGSRPECLARSQFEYDVQDIIPVVWAGKSKDALV
jgi:hypothetical protein